MFFRSALKHSLEMASSVYHFKICIKFEHNQFFFHVAILAVVHSEVITVQHIGSELQALIILFLHRISYAHHSAPRFHRISETTT